jgi:hypothetical protein
MKCDDVSHVKARKSGRSFADKALYHPIINLWFRANDALNILVAHSTDFRPESNELPGIPSQRGHPESPLKPCLRGRFRVRHSIVHRRIEIASPRRGTELSNRRVSAGDPQFGQRGRFHK